MSGGFLWSELTGSEVVKQNPKETTIKKTDIERGFEQAVYERSSQELHLWLEKQAQRALEALIEVEVVRICGQAYERGREVANYRAGSAPSSVYIGGKKRFIVCRGSVRDC